MTNTFMVNDSKFKEIYVWLNFLTKKQCTNIFMIRVSMYQATEQKQKIGIAYTRQQERKGNTELSSVKFIGAEKSSQVVTHVTQVLIELKVAAK